MNTYCKKLLSCALAAVLLLDTATTGSFFKHYETASASETAQTVYKVMPLGDSITAGWCAGSSEHQFGGYRIYLADALEQNGYSGQIDFVGKWSTGEGYDTDNNGTNGATIAKDYSWADSIQTDVNNGILETYQPDLILLQIGTNDINNQTSKDSQLDILTINDRLETLVDSILEKMPAKGVLFLASIPYMQGKSSIHNKDVDNYNAFIQTLVSKKVSEGKNVIFVDINKTIENDQFDDDLHPNQDGYKNMGLLWYDILSAFLQNPDQYVDEAKKNTPAYVPTETPVASEPVFSATPTVPPETPTTQIPSLSPAPTNAPAASALPSGDNTATDSTQSAAENPSKNGTLITKNGMTYKLTANKKETSFKASCIKVNSKKVSAKSLTFPAAVTADKRTYPVTSLGNNLLKNARIKKVVWGKNITLIGAGAFENCKNLRTVIIKGKKLTSISKKAGKKTSGVTFIVPAGTTKKYKSLLSKSGFKNYRVVTN